MTDTSDDSGRHGQMLQSWLLLLLKLAITQDQADRSAAVEMAAELDSLVKSQATFGYFSRTNREICDAIMQGRNEHSTTLLLRHASRIENQRLRQAFLGAVGLPDQHLTKQSRPRERRVKSADLWRGLR
jgi:hypothetical protein